VAVGQAVLGQAGEDPVVLAVEQRIEERDRARHAAHAAQLRDVLLLDRLYRERGEALSTSACIALVLRVSETRAAWLLDEALFFGGLPGAF
jgi:hypothetical protein